MYHLVPYSKYFCVAPSRLTSQLGIFWSARRAGNRAGTWSAKFYSLLSMHGHLLMIMGR